MMKRYVEYLKTHGILNGLLTTLFYVFFAVPVAMICLWLMEKHSFKDAASITFDKEK